MSTWYFNKNGLAINECGKYFTFNIVKLLKNDERGNWLIRMFLYIPPFMKKRYIFENFFRLSIKTGISNDKIK